MAPATLPDARVTVQDGGLGVQGPTATGVFAAIGCAPHLDTSLTPGQIVTLSRPRRAHDLLGAGPLRDLVVAALSRAATVVHAVPLAEGQAAGMPRPPVPKSGTTADLVLRVSGHATRPGVTMTVTVTTGGDLGALRLTVAQDGIAGDPVALAGGSVTVDGVVLMITLGSAGVATAGDEWTVTTTLYPEPSTASVTTAVAALLASQHRFEWISVAGESAPSLWASMATSMSHAATQHRYIHAKLQAQLAPPTAQAWQSLMVGLSQTGATTGRVQVYAAWVRMTDDIDGTTRVRGASEVGAGLSARRRAWEPVDAVRYGPIEGVTALYPDDLSDGPIAAVNAADMVVCRTIPGLRGVYIARANMLSDPGSDYGLEERRRTMDRACTLVRAAQIKYLNSTTRLNPDGTLAGIELFRAISQAPLDDMVRAGGISAASVEIDPLQDILTTEQIETEISIVPLGKLASISTTLAYANPVLLRLQAGAAPEEE